MPRSAQGTVKKRFLLLLRRINCVDPVLFVCTLALTAISIVTVYGAVDNFGQSKLKMQIAMAIVGIILTYVVANLDYHVIVDKLWLFMLIFSIAILTVTLFLGTTGAERETANKSWLTIPIVGIAIQPSEFVKITFICTFSKHLLTVGDRINRPRELLLLLLHAGAIIGCILLSGDLGVALVYIAVMLIMLFVAGLNLWYFGGGVLLLLGGLPFLWNFLAPYQQDRILVGFDPELDPLDKGWQPLLSRQCIENGGLFGVGLFGGGDYEQLAASHTDFIFATVCEKFGFLGGAVVVITLIVMAARILWIGRQASHDYGMFICVGVAAVLIAQSVENIGMCLAMLPVVGITLPFLSCGGSSLLATYILIGMVHSVRAHSPMRRIHE
ncbi:MAG: FtsW/RodA/SpoVE family cell cycle protein [Clostridia bacterium]|nr:FtsW/RodA/SpoVE family cell cycle protein [Clostridia bacterium]